MPSTIPLYSLPLLNSHNARNGEVLIDQPTIGRRALPDDEDIDDDDDEEEADTEAADGDSEGLGSGAGHRHRHIAATATAPSRSRSRGVLARAHYDAAAGPQPSESSMIIKPAWRLHLYNLLERPNSSAAAVLVHVVVTALIVFSALVTILETVPGTLRSLPGGIWFGLETSLVALFTVEYVARCAATSYSWSGLFGWVGCTSFLFPFFFFRSLQVFCPLSSFFGAVTLNTDFVINTSVLWNYGPSGYPSLLHRGRATQGHRQSFAFESSSLYHLMKCVIAYLQSTLFRFSILRTFRLLRVFRPFRYNSTLLLYVPFFLNCLLSVLM